MNSEPSTGQTQATAPHAQAFLDAAERCFARFGIAKTSMDDVAQEAGFSRTTLYRYFRDRESLIVASVKQRVEASAGPMREQLCAIEPFAKRLEEGIVRDVRRARRDPILGSLLTVNGLALADPLVGPDGVGFQLTRLLWEPLLEDARESGDLATGVKVLDACSWIAQLEIMFVSTYRADDASVRHMRRTIRTFVLPALVRPGTAGERG